MITTRYDAVAINTHGSGLPATLPVASMPCGSGTILKAYLWWTVSYQTGSSATPTLIFTDPSSTTTNIPGILVGSDVPKCWGEDGTRTFRADVTSAITGSGNYIIDFIGNTVWEVDGATLFIIYQDPYASYNGNLIIYDGCMTIAGGTLSQTLSGFNACDNSISGNAFLIASDLQDNVANTHQATLNNAVSNYPQAFWCYDSAPTSVTAGQTNAAYSISIPSDCYQWAMMGLYYQTTCPTCSPTALTYNTSQTPVSCGSLNDAMASVNITAGVGPFSYMWTPSGANTATASNLGLGVHDCAVVDSSTGCTFHVTFMIVGAVPINPNTTTIPITCFGANNGISFVAPTGGAGPYTYSWSPVSSTSATVSGLSPGIYTVTILDANNCPAMDTISMFDPPAMNVVPSSVNTTCNGSSDGSAQVVVTGGTQPYTYTWTPIGGITAAVTGLSAGTYTVTIVDATGCVSINTVTVTQPAPVIITLTPLSDSICAGQSVNLSAVASGGFPPYNYVWNNGVFVSSQTVTPTFTTTYTVIATDADLCSSQNYSVTITVNPMPLVSINPDTISICYGEGVNLLATGPGNLLWSTGDTAHLITVTPTVTTSYSVFSTHNGCVGQTATAVVTVLGIGVIADFTPNPTNGMAPLTVQFTNNSVNAASYWWDFGDMDSSIIANPIHVYGEGQFQVVLNAWDLFGCEDRMVFDFIIVEPLSSYIQNNIFTPNADGFNDVFFPKTENLVTIEAAIFNRWGEEMYRWTDIAGGWDGRVKNKPAPDGVYYYIINATGKDGKAYFHNGFVTLLR